mgnify:FL=1
MKPGNYLWGVDLGGTKTEAVILCADDPSAIIARKRIPTEAHMGYSHIIHRIQVLVSMLAEETGITPSHMGFATPGALQPATQTMKNCNTTCLNNQPLKADLEKALNVKVSIANDANCFALAETLMGVVPKVHPNAEVVFGIIMGTGVGGGVVVNGKVLNGAQGIGGEWGHNFLDASGGPCYCGKTGCVETLLSGTGLQQFYQSLAGTLYTLPEIVQRYHQGGDEAANATIERMIHQFGRALATVVNIIDTNVIVIGGGVGNIDLLYTRGAEEVCNYIFNTTPSVKLVKPLLGDSAGVFGAALLTL